MELSVVGKTVLVTGAGRGLGRRFASLLAAEGATVVVGVRSLEKAQPLIGEITDAGGAAVPAVMDVGDADSVTAAFSALADEAPPIDVVVNNAGGGSYQPALACTPEEWAAMMTSNVDGTFFVSQAAARAMVAAGRPGSIINIVSLLGLRVMSQTSAYSTAKAAAVQLTKQLALEWSRYGIRVNAIAPGYFPTEDPMWDNDAAREMMIRKVPQRRLGEAHELDAALLLLVSDASAYMTGSVLSVDGGLSVAGL